MTPSQSLTAPSWVGRTATSNSRRSTMDKYPTTDRNGISRVQPQERVMRGIFVAAAVAIAAAVLLTFGASSAEAAVLSVGVTASTTTGAVNLPFGGVNCAD